MRQKQLNGRLGKDVLEPSGPSKMTLIVCASVFASLVLSLGRGPATHRGVEIEHELQSLTANCTQQQECRASYTSVSPKRPYSVILEEIKEENEWKNDLVLFWMPETWRAAMPKVFAAWLRSYIATMGIYFGVGGAWSYYIYWVFGYKLFKAEEIPKFKAVSDQMKVAACSIPLYAVLPAVNEWVVEQGYTLAYSRISDVGIWKYVAYFILYMTSIEFCVYWQHRNLHDVKIGYKVLHFIHHKYNKEHSLSPFAGLAFHPLDGILQAIPYCWTLFYVPMHFMTHELLLFATGIWTTNIHDNVHGDCAPILGAKFHTIHHTAYNFNYGHWTIFMDKWFGTLLDPDDYPAWLDARSSSIAKERELKSQLRVDKKNSDLARKVVAVQAIAVTSS